MRIEIDSPNIPYQEIVKGSALSEEDKRQLTLLFEKLVFKGHLGAAASSRLEYFLGKIENVPLYLHPKGGLHHYLLTTTPGPVRSVAQVNQREGDYGKTKLQIAIANYKEASRERISALLSDSAIDVNLTDKDGWSPAYQATELLDPWVLEQLALHGARFGSKNKDGSTPLIRAADRNNVPALKVLLKQKLDLNQSNDVGTALTYAVKKGHIQAVQLLLEAGADANKADMTGLTPLALAKRFGKVDLIPLLEKYHAKEKAPISAIHEAVLAGQLRDGVDEYGRSAAHYCALENNIGLLEKAGDLDRPDRFQRTPLHYAALMGNREAVRFLKNDRNLNLGDKQGQTPLHFAAEYNQLAIIEELDGDVNKTDNFGWTPLDKAAAFNSTPCVDYLCGKVVNIDRQALDGRTALHKAAVNQSGESYNLLLQQGARGDIEDKHGKKAADYLK